MSLSLQLHQLLKQLKHKEIIKNPHQVQKQEKNPEAENQNKIFYLKKELMQL